VYESIIPKDWERWIEIDKIIADAKVYSDGVKMYEEMMKRDEETGLIVLVKHPSKDLYAVLDGHHRFHAYLKLGVKEVPCIVLPAMIGFLFDITKEGVLQPTEEFTKYVRVPFKKIESFLIRFLDRPEEFLKLIDKRNEVDS